MFIFVSILIRFSEEAVHSEGRHEPPDGAYTSYRQVRSRVFFFSFSHRHGVNLQGCWLLVSSVSKLCFTRVRSLL